MEQCVKLSVVSLALAVCCLLPSTTARLHKPAKSRANELDMCERVQADYDALRRECDVDTLLTEEVNNNNKLYECFSKPGLSYKVGESFFLMCALEGAEPEPWQFMCFECGAELVYRPETAEEKEKARNGIAFKF